MESGFDDALKKIIEERNKPQQPTADSFASRIIEDIKVQRKIFEGELHGLSFRHETIPAQELEQVMGVKKMLKDFLERYDASPSLKSSPDVLRQYVRDIEATLDSLPLWRAKFTTGDYGDREPDMDSVYYVTPSGMSLRLKTHNLRHNDLRRVVQPFMEHIQFDGDVREHKEDPTLGYSVFELASEDLRTLLDKEDTVTEDFVSRVKKFYRPDKALHHTEMEKKPYYKHEGHEVNHIFFDRLQDSGDKPKNEN